jgi:hypothetical protein
MKSGTLLVGCIMSFALVPWGQPARDAGSTSAHGKQKNISWLAGFQIGRKSAMREVLLDNILPAPENRPR